MDSLESLLNECRNASPKHAPFADQIEDDEAEGEHTSVEHASVEQVKSEQVKIEPKGKIGFSFKLMGSIKQYGFIACAEWRKTWKSKESLVSLTVQELKSSLSNAVQKQQLPNNPHSLKKVVLCTLLVAGFVPQHEANDVKQFKKCLQSVMQNTKIRDGLDSITSRPRFSWESQDTDVYKALRVLIFNREWELMKKQIQPEIERVVPENARSARKATWESHLNKFKKEFCSGVNDMEMEGYINGVQRIARTIIQSDSFFLVPSTESATEAV